MLAEWIDLVWFGTDLGARVIIGGALAALVFGFTAAAIDDNIPATSTTGDVALITSWVLAVGGAAAFVLGLFGMLVLRVVAWVVTGA